MGTRIVAKVENGTITPAKGHEIKAAFGQYEGRTIEVIVQEADSGTSAQTKYWWGVCIPHFQEAMGEYDPNDVHETLLEHLMPELCERSHNALNGQTRIRRPSWAKMNKEQRGQCIDRAIIFGATFYHIAIPEPE